MTFTFTQDQQNTMDTFIGFLADDQNPYMIIQGSSGTGKSTMIEHLVKTAIRHRKMLSLLLKKNRDTKPVIIHLTATTNPAAAVLEKLTGIEAITIHSLLGLIPRPNFKTGGTNLVLTKSAEKVYDSLIIIDESSMINDELFKYIENRCINCKIVFIGDWYQLAPVGQLKVTMQSIPGTQALMNKIMRNSGIIMETGQQFRHTVETGKFKPIPKGHTELLHVDGATFKDMINSEFTDADYTPQRARVLAYKNERVLEYSSHIRKATGQPAELQVNEIVITNKPILSGSMHISIDSEVQITGMGKSHICEESGIPGKIVEINGRHESFMPIDTNDAIRYMKRLANKEKWQDYYHVKNNWLDLRLPYASTIHKIQGNQCNKVFIDLTNIGECYIPSDVARMLYVGITRATEQVILYGELPYKYQGG